MYDLVIGDLFIISFYFFVTSICNSIHHRCVALLYYLFSIQRIINSKSQT
jgi:hypothetical protein